MSRLGARARTAPRHRRIEIGAQVGSCDLVDAVDQHDTCQVGILRHGLIETREREECLAAIWSSLAPGAIQLRHCHLVNIHGNRYCLCRMRARSTTHVCVWAIALAATGCISGPGTRQLSGTYVHPQTGGVIIFEANDRFYYSFIAPAKGLPRNLGHYHFDTPTDTVPDLRVRSAHNDLFSIRVSQSGDRVFLTHPKIFAGEQVYERQ